MPRASWRGFLRLSLVSCPVYLSPATTRTKPIRLHQVWQPAPVDVDEDDLPDLGGSAPSVTRLRADNAGADGDESPAATRITLRPHDPGTGEEIEKREVVKGYEYRWHQLFSLFRLLTLIFEAARRVHRLWRLGRRFLQCRRALAHVFEMTLARHRLDEEIAHRPDQRIDPVW
jgi:Ku70/Ku80 beta-barrel domain